jgi:hypothetical protein
MTTVTPVEPEAPQPPLVVDLAGLARLLGRNVDTVRGQVKRGWLPPPCRGGGKNGRKLYWRTADICRWVELGCPSQAEQEAATHEKGKRKR